MAQASPRRWNKRPPRISAADLAVWCFVVLAVAAVVLVACMALKVVWPG